MTEGPDATTLTTSTGALTDFIVTETRVQLTVDAWIAQSKKFSDFEASRIKGNYNLQQRYLKEDLAPKLAKKFDQVILGQAGIVKDYQLHTGTSLVAINNTAITEAIRIAESYSLPIEEMAFFIHPNTYKNMRLLWETIRCKFRKFRENLYETILSEAQKWERATTIIGTPQMVMG